MSDPSQSGDRRLTDESGAGRSLPALFLVLYLVWGFTYVALKIGQRWTGPWTMAGLRALIGGLALILVAWALGRAAPAAGRHRPIALIGLLNVTGLAGGMSLGLTQVGAGEAALLIYSQPLLVVVLAALVLGERLTRRQALGLLLGFGGMVVVLAPRLQPSAAAGWWAYGALLLGSGAWALSSVLVRHWQRRGGSPLAAVDVLWLTGLQALYGALPLLAVAASVEGLRLTPSLDLAWTLAFTGLLATGLANAVWFTLLRRYAAVVSAAPVFLIPAFATSFGALVLGEALPPTLIAGGLLTMAGIAFVTWPARRT